MFTDLLYKYRSSVGHGVLFVCLALFVSCGSPERKEAALYLSDASAKAEVARVNQILSAGYPLTAQDFESIKRIREKYPSAKEARAVFQSALIRRGDWESLVNSIETVPEAEKTREDRLNLAKSYLKLGRYQSVVDAVRPLADAAPQDLELNSLLAGGYFYLGRHEEAAARLDAVWSAVLQNKRIDEINTRGMIYFRAKNYEKAVETFQKALEINPEDISANNALSRVYAAQGNNEQAEIFRLKTEKAQAAIGNAEAKKSRAVQNAYQLEDAWNARRYDEVISLARQMLNDADEKNKPALYQYLIESHKALGRTEEARKILAEAQNTKQK